MAAQSRLPFVPLSHVPTSFPPNRAPRLWLLLAMIRITDEQWALIEPHLRCRDAKAVVVDLGAAIASVSTASFGS